MRTIGIVGGGPLTHIPSLAAYASQIDYWIGADEGALFIVDQGVPLHTAIGDFDSISVEQKENLQNLSPHVIIYPEEKDETDLELAINHAMDLEPTSVLFFGVTGGRMDHSLINIQLLYTLQKQEIDAKIIDQQNEISLFTQGNHVVKHSETYPYISFIPMSEQVEGLFLTGFYYPLENRTITWGSSLCLSNKLLFKKGNFSFTSGILILIKSRDKKTQPMC